MWDSQWRARRDITSLDPDDIDSFFGLVTEKVSAERAKELRLYLGMV